MAEIIPTLAQITTATKISFSSEIFQSIFNLTNEWSDNEPDPFVKEEVLQNGPGDDGDGEDAQADVAGHGHVDLTHVVQGVDQIEQTGDHGPGAVNGGAVLTQNHIGPEI